MINSSPFQLRLYVWLFICSRINSFYGSMTFLILLQFVGALLSFCLLRSIFNSILYLMNLQFSISAVYFLVNSCLLFLIFSYVSKSGLSSPFRLIRFVDQWRFWFCFNLQVPFFFLLFASQHTCAYPVLPTIVIFIGYNLP